MMTTPNFSNRTLFISDNLPVLEGMDSETIDLVLIDPPFNSKRQFQGIGKASKAKFKDIWSWRADVHPSWMPKMREHNRALVEVIEAAYHASDPGMAAYIAFMSIRVLELHRVLKSTGSMYLHCDPTASHYLKAMMDAVFGPGNFRNEITWQRATVKGSRGKRKSLGSVTDTILFYGKTGSHVVEIPTTMPTKMPGFPHLDGRGNYRPVTRLMAEAGLHDCPRYEWNGLNPEYGWRVSLENLKRLAAEDRIHFNSSGRPYRKQYEWEYQGVAVGDIWVDIKFVAPGSKERIGWPTQKPLKLYRRIIEASTNEGDMILDAFAGCATTCVAAEQLGRQWVGIDIAEEAEVVTRDRLRRETRLFAGGGERVDSP